MYRQVTGIKRIRPIVAAMVRQNEDTYPFHSVISLSSSFFPLRLLNGALKRIGAQQWVQAVENGYLLNAAIKNVKPAVIWAQSGWSAARLISALEHSDIPLAVSFYGTDITAIDREGWYSDAFPRVVARTSTAIFPSRFLLEKAHALGWRFKNEFVIPHGVPRRAEPVSFPSPDSRPLRIVCVARFTEEKGHEVLVEAAASLRHQGTPFEVLLVGGGPLLKTMQHTVEARSLTSVFTFKERLGVEGTVEAMKWADVIVLPSVRCKAGTEESFGVVLLEAASLGRPCVASNIGGIPEIVEDGNTGILVPERDPTALAEALTRLTIEKDLLARLGRAARNRVEKKYAIDESVRLIEEALFDTIGTRENEGASTNG